MRTFLSHDATARCSDCGENASSDMLSSGGEVSVMSPEVSPVAVALVVLVAGVEPKSPDIIVDDGERWGKRW